MPIYLNPSYNQVIRGVPSLNELPIDLIRYILKFLENSEKIPLKFLNKKFTKLICLSKLYSDNVYAPGLMKGSIQYLKWAKRLHYPLNYDLCRIPAKRGHLHVLKWLKKNKCTWNAMTLTCAAQNSHLEILKWIKKRLYPMDEWTCYSAAAAGQLEALKWLRKNRCPWNNRDCLQVASDPLVRKWIMDN